MDRRDCWSFYGDYLPERFHLRTMHLPMAVDALRLPAVCGAGGHRGRRARPHRSLDLASGSSLPLGTGICGWPTRRGRTASLRARNSS